MTTIHTHNLRRRRRLEYDSWAIPRRRFTPKDRQPTHQFWSEGFEAYVATDDGIYRVLAQLTPEDIAAIAAEMEQ